MKITKFRELKLEKSWNKKYKNLRCWIFGKKKDHRKKKKIKRMQKRK
jgi:hypothetical protein